MRMDRLLGLLFGEEESVVQCLSVTATASQIEISVTGTPKAVIIKRGADTSQQGIHVLCVAFYEYSGTVGYIGIGTEYANSSAKFVTSETNPLASRISNGVLTLTDADFKTLTDFQYDRSFFTTEEYKVMLAY